MESVNVEKTEFSFPSVKGDVECHAIKWVPVGVEPRAIVQIVHGMVEYVDRYDQYARDLCAAGFMVVGHDHIGHGDSVNSTKEWGVMPMDDGAQIMVEDVQSLRTLVQGECGEELPYFIQGHSMGSFVVRCYAEKHAAGLAGLIVEGTGNPPAAASKFGKTLCGMLAKMHGPTYISKFVYKLANGGYAKYSPDYKTPVDWISRDDEVVAAYLANPKTTFAFSVSGYNALLSLTAQCAVQASVDKIPKELPIFIASGSEDPVGEGGKGPKELYGMCTKAGIADVSIKLYEGARHELHNEIDREVFIGDAIAWIDAHIPRG